MSATKSNIKEKKAEVDKSHGQTCICRLFWQKLLTKAPNWLVAIKGEVAIATAN